MNGRWLRAAPRGDTPTPGRRAVLRSAVTALLFALLSSVHGHSEHVPESAEPKRQILAPGWEALAYEAPVPGSYALPDLGLAHDGDVLTADGEFTKLHALFGDKLVLLSFIYTGCSDVNGCPLATAVLSRTKRRIDSEPALVDRLRLISLSFDPVHDTPAVMKSYAEAFLGRGDIEWRFLTTSSKERLAPILHAYGQSTVKEYDEQGNSLGTIAHILRVFLIDREKHVRNIYGVSFLHADTLVNDVKTLLLEERDGVRVATDSELLSVVRKPVLQGPGDFKEGYESEAYETRSRALLQRTGKPANLLQVLEQPPLGLPAVPRPSENPPTAKKIQLGRKLFFDRRLSHNNTVSCAMCHVPEQGFTSNELATAVGIEGRTVRRNTPTLYNVAYFRHLFHDGRENLLEQQVWAPMLAKNEMGNPSIGVVTQKIKAMRDYDGMFEMAFDGRGPTMETIGMAIASYERTLLSANSPFDHWFFGERADALDERAKRGFALFRGKAGCAACHTVGEDHALFTDDRFHNTGLGYWASMRKEPVKRKVQVAPGVFLEVDGDVVADASEPRPNDLGRYEITQVPDDRWKYKTPTLRNVSLTAPYMHNGSLNSLREVVEFYNRGGVPNEGLDPAIRPLGLDKDEVGYLITFLNSLTGDTVDELVADAFDAPVSDVVEDTEPH